MKFSTDFLVPDGTYCFNLDKRTGAGELGVADPAAAGAQRHLFSEHVYQRCALPLCPPLPRAGCCLPPRPPHWASFLHNLTSDFRNFAKYVVILGTTIVKYGVRSPKFIWAPVYSCTHGLDSAIPPSPRIWAHIRGRYWSAKIDDISL